MDTYENKYKEAQKWIESIYSELSHEQQMEAEAFFHELKESEDERIRKEIIETFKNLGDGKIPVDINYADIFTWLEKQGKEIPVCKVEPFDKYEGLTDFERTLADICIGWIGEEIGWKQYIKDNAGVLFKIAVEKFNSVQDVPFEQKPAWSEEDKDAIGMAIIALEDMYDEDAPNTTYGGYNLPFNKAAERLKSLKQIIGWKPSDAQMGALLSKLPAIKGSGYEIQCVLETLYDDLKKLKGE